MIAQTHNNFIDQKKFHRRIINQSGMTYVHSISAKAVSRREREARPLYPCGGERGLLRRVAGVCRDILKRIYGIGICLRGSEASAFPPPL